MAAGLQAFALDDALPKRRHLKCDGFNKECKGTT